MRLFTALLLLIFSVNSLASSAKILNIRLLEEVQQITRLIFELDSPSNHSVFTLNSPYRLVIDFENAQLVKAVPNLPTNHSILKNIRSSARNNNDLRVVLDLKQSINAKSFLLNPSGDYKYRLIIDLSISTNGISSATSSAQLPIKQATPAPSDFPPARAVEKKPEKSPAYLPKAPKSLPFNATGKRDIIVAIDAGHGGVDPGAVGKLGSYEKDIVLAIARSLYTLLANEEGFQPVMIRQNDTFLKLRERIDLAREYQADLFVSIHADAYANNDTAKGPSVYMLSQSGASSEAVKWLAEKENSADLVGGGSISDKDDLLASVLLDLSQTGTLEASARVGSIVLKSLNKVSKLHHSKVQHAAFMVLRSPDIPSILVETGFISTPNEEQKLQDPDYRYRLAYALLEGIISYFTQYPPPGTLLVRQ